ncbi:MAG: nicotinate (nicotinamide) nucleotide adenylyltransferase [Bacteroidaceae bacterium]|nr:nicotinate (nicotinamide) nucleotide adenylyltransferase [Bacteroidaceae bacterium]
MKKIGLFGGSFNPIHIGHLALANFLCENRYVDEIWFLVSPQNPLKKQEELLNDEERLTLAQLAIGDYPHFKVSDFEFQLPRPSYTYHTLGELKKAYPEHLFTLLIGSDNWQIFHKWKDADLILKENPLIIYPRVGFTVDKKMLPAHVLLANTPTFDVSSTFIRESIQTGKDIRFFLTPAVYTYIKAHQLYIHKEEK